MSSNQTSPATKKKQLPNSGSFKSTYTKELGELVCRRIATHDVGTASLCKMYDDMPPISTIYDWLYDYPEFDEAYKLAKAKQAFLMADTLDEVAMEKHYYIDSEGNSRIDPGFVNDKRLRIDTRKWIAAKLLPKVYNDKVTQEIVIKHEDDLKSLD